MIPKLFLPFPRPPKIRSRGRCDDFDGLVSYVRFASRERRKSSAMLGRIPRRTQFVGISLYLYSFPRPSAATHQIIKFRKVPAPLCSSEIPSLFSAPALAPGPFKVKYRTPARPIHLAASETPCCSLLCSRERSCCTCDGMPLDVPAVARRRRRSL